MGLGIELMLIAAVCSALSNLCLRRSIDAGGTSQVFLMVQLGLTAVVTFLLGPMRTGDFTWSSTMAIFAISGGVILAAFMSFLGKALENGPPGLTVAMLSCSSVVPILVMVMLFGTSFGFNYTSWNAIGSILVVVGLCWAGWQIAQGTDRRKWLIFVSLAFLLHAVYLAFLQWRALFINFPGAEGLGFSVAREEAASQWFMPILFLTSALVQIFLFFKNTRRKPIRGEVVYGLLGGLANGSTGFFMIRSTEVATSLEQAMIFPIFCVTLIVACNAWGRWLYREQIHWKGNACSIAGLIIGTVDWTALLA